MNLHFFILCYDSDLHAALVCRVLLWKEGMLVRTEIVAEWMRVLGFCVCLADVNANPAMQMEWHFFFLCN